MPDDTAKPSVPHVLFVHPNFPAQFGHVASTLATGHGWRCTFVSQTPPGNVGGVEKIQYGLAGGARAENHFCSRTFENNVWHCDGVLRALVTRPDVRPDLIVGHSGFGSTLFLRELFPDVPVVNLFEYYYLPHDPESDMSFRTDLVELGWRTGPDRFLRARCRNAMIHLDLENCQRGYCPTAFQRSRFPQAYRDKLDVVFDGIDRRVWHPHDDALRPPAGRRPSRVVAGVTLPPDARILTYCSRGFESMRGFDVFMRGIRRVTQADARVHVFVVGEERVAYGGDDEHTGGKSFKRWTLDHNDVRGFARDRVHFIGRVPPRDLAVLLATGDAHVYLTVPFVLSWSLINAMSCGATVVASDTSPVREAVTHGKTGLLFDFFDPQALADAALQVLDDPGSFRHLGHQAAEKCAADYDMDVTLPRLLGLFDKARQTPAGLERPRPRFDAHPFNAPPRPAPTLSPFAG